MNTAQRTVLNLTAAMIANTSVVMTYVDRDGVVSTRTIRPLSIERCKTEPYRVVVRAYDENRNAPRTFRLSRIVSATV